MTFKDLFESGETSRNVSHFAAIVQMALVDGELKDTEAQLLQQFAKKLNIEPPQYEQILKDPKGFPINPPSDAESRLQRLWDLFRIIFADAEIDVQERKLLERYAIGLGYNEATANALITRSISIFSGGLDFEDYQYLIQKK